MNVPLRYAALGSSFAAGPAIAPVVDPNAMRSGRNYPHLLAGRLGAELTDLTTSGASTATILDQSQVTITGAEYPPQLWSVPESVDLVTVTAGGNDLNYAGSMLFTAWQRVQPDGPFTTMMAAGFADGIPVPTADDVERTAAGLAQIVERVRVRAPRARVLLVDYLTVIGGDTAPSDEVPFEPGEIEAFRVIQSALEAAYTAAADRTGAELVAVSQASRDHALGTAEPWVASFAPDLMETAGSFHPNAAGMAAVADLLGERLH
ncbi:SGNH/GDSL hydrolase family protein [Actinomadura rugatobispora]|uniref:SGNH/GDSL hydrolase family protein n=1 Tax=Actinomadura rugatobispora TaxID=1994 RepID=A0ABW1AAB2_9ACTN|nr:SGNH/GDSL hydrolase family protein [Actinomadura rugatobispora]